MPRWPVPFASLRRMEIVLPVLLTAALLAFAFVLGDLPTAFGRVRALPFAVIAGGFALAALYWALKGLLFRQLLAHIGIQPDWRRLGAAYAVGEMCLTIPAGMYAQNWVLSRIHGADIARSAAATTGILAVEGTLLILVLAVLAIPGWPWLRPAVLGIMAVLGAAFLVLMSTLGRRPKRLRRGRLRAVRVTLFRFLLALRALGKPLLLLEATALTAIYLTALVVAFMLVGRAVGNPGFTLVQAATIYFFSLGVSMLFGGVLSQLGVVESVGIGAAQAWGYGATDALAMLLGFRLVWMGSIWVVSGACLWLLRRELRWPRHRADASADDQIQKALH
jgi:uncharacterized membrane protein YbhN (UPF0104 family)